MSSHTLPAGISSMEPMLPNMADPELAELSRRIFVEGGALRASVPHAETRRCMSVLVREMNSYYSNLIEGHKTLPRDIERALRDDYLDDARMRLNQHQARAHIEVQAEMVARLENEPDLNVYGQEFLCWLHASFYRHLPEEACAGRTESGRLYRLDIGDLRTFNVDVGRHTPPDYCKLDAFLRRFSNVYRSDGILETNRLSALAAAHHRLAWIHPFGDGNGRVARLQSHAALVQLGVDADGLWALSRGLARHRSVYYRRLAVADGARRNDYDGRGNLSAVGLQEFCLFFLKTMLDQIEFMAGLLNTDGLLHRIGDYVHRESGITRHADRLVRLLSAAFREGTVSRGQVPDIVGLKPSASRQVTALALREGLLQSPSPKGSLSIAFPAKVLDAYFPRLFLDLPYEDE
jgi:Fic family protein